MARLPSAPAQQTLVLAGEIVTAKDIMFISTDAVEAEGGAIGFKLPLPGDVSMDEFLRRAELAAGIIHRAITSAAGQSMAAQARVTPGDQSNLARDMAAKAEALVSAIMREPAAPAGDIPTTLALMLEHIAAAVPPHRAQPYVIERMMHGSVWFSQVVDVRTEQDMPPGEPSPLSMTSEEADAFRARLAPSTPEQEERGRAEAAVFAAMKMLPDALGMLVAMAGAAKTAANDAAARDRRDEHKRGGPRTDPFAGIVMRGMANAYRVIFDSWPSGRPDNGPAPGRPDAREWTHAVLDAAHVNLTNGAVRGDSMFVAERVARMAALAVTTLGNHLNVAVSAEGQE